MEGRQEAARSGGSILANEAQLRYKVVLPLAEMARASTYIIAFVNNLTITIAH